MHLTSEQSKQIEILYKEMYLNLCTYAMYALNQRTLAEEAVQDTFRIACLNADRLFASKNPKGWIMNTLKNVIRNIRRSHSMLSNLFLCAISEENLISTSFEDNVSFYITYEKLLGKEDFYLLQKIVLERYTMLEVATELGISVEACKKRVQRAKKKLKNTISKKTN